MDNIGSAHSTNRNRIVGDYLVKLPHHPNSAKNTVFSMFKSSTTQPTKFIWPAARAFPAKKTWLMQYLKAPLRNLQSLFCKQLGLLLRENLVIAMFESSATQHLKFVSPGGRTLSAEICYSNLLLF